MNSLPEKNIVVEVSYDGLQYELSTFTNEYRSLMMLIYDRIFTEGFGDCLGMGKCGTCIIEVTRKIQEPTAYTRNGDVNLLRAGQFSRDIYLSCQLMIDERMNGLTVRVLT